MKLIDDVKGVWKHYSMIALTASGTIQGAWVALPDVVKKDLPTTTGEWVCRITTAIIFLGMVGKVIKQGGDAPPAP